MRDPPARQSGALRRRQIGVGNLVEARRVEARSVAAKRQADRQAFQPMHGIAVGSAVGAGQIVDEFVIIDRVAAEEQAVGLIEEADGVGRMAGQFEHREAPVAEVHEITLGELSGQRCRRDAVVRYSPARLGQPGDRRVDVAKQMRQRQRIRHACKSVGRTLGAEALGKFVQRADVVDMDMGRHNDQRLAARVDLGRERHEPHAGVDQQIGVAAGKVPDIGAEVGMDTGLGQAGEACRHRRSFIPARGPQSQVARKLVVHIGMPRAGSSTLQEVLFHYRDRLLAHGLLYPVLSPGTAGTVNRAQVYNHKLLLQSARSFWPPGRFATYHQEIATGIAACAAPLVLLSYEGWWDPGNLRGLQKTIRYLHGHCGGLETEIAAVVREPVAFLMSLYKLDVLHGRTTASFSAYWPAKLNDPRLRYDDIQTALIAAFSNVRMWRFEDLVQDNMLVARILAEIGAPGILKQAGVPALEYHRSKGGENFSDSIVSLFLFAARHLGQRQTQAKRTQVLELAKNIAAHPEHAEACRALAIPIRPEEQRSIATATKAQTGPFYRDQFSSGVPQYQEHREDSHQATITDDSDLGRVVLEALKTIRR